MNTRKGPHALRFFVIMLGVFMFALAIWCHETKADPAAVAILVTYAIIFIAGTVFERWRYKPEVSKNDPSWKKTDEVFLDPVTGENVRVWFNSRTGERDYRSHETESLDEAA